MPLSMFVVLHLTESEAQFIRDNMRLTCMNEPGPASDMACRIERVVSRWCASAFSPDGYYAADEARDVFRAVCLGMPHKVRVKYFTNKGTTTERKD